MQGRGRIAGNGWQMLRMPIEIRVAEAQAMVRPGWHGVGGVGWLHVMVTAI